MRPKSPVRPCRFCHREFRRTEHLLRHERTHTNEKPFSCNCGKAFSRQDLLTRHARLTGHGSFGKSGSTDPAPAPQAGTIGDTFNPEGTEPANEEAATNKDVNAPTSNVEAQVGSSQYALVSPLSPVAHPVPSSLRDDLDLLWGDFSMSSALLQSTSYTLDYPINFPTFSEYGFGPLHTLLETPNQPRENEGGSPALLEHDQSGALSRYGSRLPSPTLRPETDTQAVSEAPSLLSMTEPNVPWRISRPEYNLITAAVRQHWSVLPSEFVFPSRHALRRYVEGYFSGFHEHLPFLHIPTISMASSAPELVLAIAAAGARYRFQRTQALQLYMAARALIELKLRQHDGCSQTPSPSNLDAQASPNMYTPSHSSNRSRGTRNPLTDAIEGGTSPLNDQNDGDRLQLMQAMILIIAFGTWNQRTLLKDAFALGDGLALLAREDGLSEGHAPAADLTWTQWTALESRRRTKHVAFAFLNLHSIAYNIPPKLMNSEMNLLLPYSESQWRAPTETTWLTEKQRDPSQAIPFQTGYANLFIPSPRPTSPSSFGNYILIHTIVQQIFFVRQSSPAFAGSTHGSLKQEDVDMFEGALRRWQRNWESTKDSSVHPVSPGGPLSFNSLALLRIAYIRLHLDLGPHRHLPSRDPLFMAQHFRDGPHLARSVNVCRAVLQSAHALSIPVRVGVEYVARTHALNWSIVHSISNLECAIFLSRWLNCVGTKTAEGQVADENETRLLGLVRGILDETDLRRSVEMEMDEARRYKCMASVVVGLWAEMFAGEYTYDLSGCIGEGLRLHEEILQGELAQSP